jgi:hypothetical protein
MLNSLQLASFSASLPIYEQYWKMEISPFINLIFSDARLDWWVADITAITIRKVTLIPIMRKIMVSLFTSVSFALEYLKCTATFRSSAEPLPDYNPQFLSHTYNFLESLCIYYILTCDHKHKFPFTKVLTIGINLYSTVLIDYNTIAKMGTFMHSTFILFIFLGSA